MELKKICEVLDCTGTCQKVMNILIDGIEKADCKDCKEICETVYRCLHGDILIPEMCEELISEMSNGEHNGSVWSLEDTNSVAKKLDINFNLKPYTPEEFRTVMNMEFYEHNIPMKKSGINIDPICWGRIADYALCKDPSKLVDYYFD